MACEVADIKNIKKVIVLSDGTYTGQQGYPVIFKYQSAEHIMKEIFAQAADDDQITGVSHMYSSKQAELIAVFSPFGGAGASTYARNMCAEMSGNNNILYINLEIFDSFAEFEKDVESKREYICGMSEAVYYIKQKKDKLAFKLESITNHHKNGYNYILPVEDYRDLYSITPDDMEYFTDVLGRETMYDKVVFDIGYISEASLKLLSLCDVLIVPEPVGYQINNYELDKLKKKLQEQLISDIAQQNYTSDEEIYEVIERNVFREAYNVYITADEKQYLVTRYS